MALRPAAAAALAVLAAAPGACAQGLEPAGRFTWATAAVTELSAIEVAGNGLDFVAVSDRGWLLRGRFDRQDGRIAGVQVGTLAPILGNDGLPVAARRVGDWADAEGLAVAADGSCWVSFERWAHVARYDGCTGAGQWIRDHPDFAALADNRQLEALAVDAQGVLYTLPEEPPEASRDGGFTLWRLDPAGWAVAGQVPQADGFAVVGADFDDAGDCTSWNASWPWGCGGKAACGGCGLRRPAIPRPCGPKSCGPAGRANMATSRASRSGATAPHCA
jgi:Esterase-like activity of phytase